jgi:hypothetical protein
MDMEGKIIGTSNIAIEAYWWLESVAIDLVISFVAPISFV